MNLLPMHTSHQQAALQPTSTQAPPFMRLTQLMSYWLRPDLGFATVHATFSFQCMTRVGWRIIMDQEREIL